MSLYEFEESRKIAMDDPSFYALIMAAARRADTENLARLEDAFPDAVSELRRRFHAPGGLLPGESANGLRRRPDGLLVDERTGEVIRT